MIKPSTQGDVSIVSQTAAVSDAEDMTTISRAQPFREDRIESKALDDGMCKKVMKLNPTVC